MIFWASWVFGPAAGPKGASIFSPKIGRALPAVFLTGPATPKRLPDFRYSSRAQVIRLPKGMGRMISLIDFPPFMFCD